MLGGRLYWLQRVWLSQDFPFHTVKRASTLLSIQIAEIFDVPRQGSYS